MRARVAAVLSALVVAVVIGAGVPLALAVSATEARTVQLDRLADAARLASLVAPAEDPVGEQALEAELLRYDDVYGIAVAVTDSRGRVAYASRAAPAFDAGPVRAAVEESLAGRYPGPPEPLLPWQDRLLVVSVPVVSDGEVIAALVSLSPPHPGAERVARTWAVLALGALMALAVGVALAWQLASWLIRPLTTLDRVARDLRPGRFSSRVPALHGPPEMRRLADSFNHMADSVQTSFEAQDTFVADAGHQLRNPLGALLVRLDGLALDLGADPATRRHVGSATAAVRDGRHLAETLDTMLELARARHNDSRAVPMDLVPVVQERLLAWSVVAAPRDVVLDPRLPVAATACHDPAAVAGALDVVIDNAVRYSPPGGVVTLTLDRVDDEQRLHVANRIAAGVRQPSPASAGGPAAVSAAASAGGPTGETSGGPPAGAGIGLAIASTLVHLHGGRLVIEDGEDGVRRVDVVLPARCPAEATRPPATA